MWVFWRRTRGISQNGKRKMRERVLASCEAEFVKQLLQESQDDGELLRVDGRGQHEMRRVQLKLGEQKYGQVTASIGNTKCVLPCSLAPLLPCSLAPLLLCSCSSSGMGFVALHRHDSCGDDAAAAAVAAVLHLLSGCICVQGALPSCMQGCSASRRSRNAGLSAIQRCPFAHGITRLFHVVPTQRAGCLPHPTSRTHLP